MAETGSMLVEASQHYGITQSAVSHPVRPAEAATLVILQDRSRRPLKSTRAGRILAKRFHDISRDFGSLLDALHAATTVPERVDLRLGLVDSYAGTVGAYLVKELVTGAMAMSLRPGWTSRLRMLKRWCAGPSMPRSPATR